MITRIKCISLSRLDVSLTPRLIPGLDCTLFIANYNVISVRTCFPYHNHRWTSSAGLNSAYYDLRGATIIKTLQFRFQIMNLTGWDRGRKSTQREFAAESYTDMEEWVRALQEVS